tara:strand:- start:9221 stop:9823 length:603 start_codon:yes stop_codon:yes gene_type:complete
MTKIRGNELYNKSTKFRDVHFRPLIVLLAKLKITPSMISYFAVFLMVIFIFVLPHKPYLALSLMLFSLILDFVDGVLARYLKTDSDKGKFIDMICDNLNFTLLIIGLVVAGLIQGIFGAILVYVMAFSKVIRTIYHASTLKSDWKFKAVAGVLPNLYAAILAISFILHLAFSISILNETAIFLSALLIIDSVRYYLKVLQ